MHSIYTLIHSYTRLRTNTLLPPHHGWQINSILVPGTQDRARVPPPKIPDPRLKIARNLDDLGFGELGCCWFVIHCGVVIMYVKLVLNLGVYQSVDRVHSHATITGTFLDFPVWTIVNLLLFVLTCPWLTRLSLIFLHPHKFSQSNTEEFKWYTGSYVGPFYVGSFNRGWICVVGGACRHAQGSRSWQVLNETIKEFHELKVHENIAYLLKLRRKMQCSKNRYKTFGMHQWHSSLPLYD